MKPERKKQILEAAKKAEAAGTKHITLPVVDLLALMESKPATKPASKTKPAADANK